MEHKAKHRSGGVAYVAILGSALAILVIAVEWARRTNPPDTPLPAASPSPGPFPRKVQDATGETLEIAARPNRIVSQTLATDEILLAICPVERIVALSSLAEDENYSNVVAEARRVAGRTTEGAEQILRLEPDLIFVASYSRADTVQVLMASRAPVFRSANFNSIADIQANIRTVGHAIGNDTEADTLVRQMDQSLTAIRARVPPDRPVLRIMSFSRDGYTAGANTTFDDVVRATGAVNLSAANGIDGFAKISVEKIAEWQPDVIVAGANHNEIESVRRKLLTDPVIATSQVGRTGRVVVIDNRHFLTVSQHIVRAVEDLAEGLYGK